MKEDRTVSGTKQTVYKKMASVRQCEFEGKNVYDLHSFEKLNDPLLALAQILLYGSNHDGIKEKYTKIILTILGQIKNATSEKAS